MDEHREEQMKSALVMGGLAGALWLIYMAIRYRNRRFDKKHCITR